MIVPTWLESAAPDGALLSEEELDTSFGEVMLELSVGLGTPD